MARTLASQAYPLRQESDAKNELLADIHCWNSLPTHFGVGAEGWALSSHDCGVQIAGLRHFEDMQVKIPREEGQEIAETVTQAALQLFGWSMDTEDAPHIRPMGSFLRGKRGTSVRTPVSFGSIDTRKSAYVASQGIQGNDCL